MNFFKRLLTFVMIIATLLGFNMSVIAGATNGEEKNVLKISTAAELMSFAANVNAGNTYQGYTVVLTTDIDMSNYTWTPIGYNFNNYFAGVFNGANHTISELKTSISIDAANIINTPYHTVAFLVCAVVP